MDEMRNMRVIDSACTLARGRVKELLAEMDRCAIEQAIIGPEKKYFAIDNKSGNSYIAHAARQHPDRLTGFAIASPWLGKKALAELNRALDLGLTGLKIYPAVQGFILTDPQIFPLIEFAEKARWPVYCATGTPICAMPLQLAELAERYPRAKFIMGHGGFCDFWNDIPDALRRCSNLYIETSYILPSQITAWIKEAGIGRFVFGSDLPFSSLDLELKKISLLSERIDKERILRKNILRVLRKTR
jgi:predicted TIM-barrel fold metal-dependent hydrolase